MSLKDYFTQTLKKDEAVVAIIRKHWITFVLPLVGSIIAIGVLIGFVDFFFRSSLGAIIWFVLLVLALLFAVYYWIIHYFDSFIITDIRIIDIDQRGLFKRTVSETTFDKVQDVTYSIVGIVATGLDFGTVSVQTAGTEGKIELDHVPHPRKVHEIVLEAQLLFKERHAGDMSAQELIELIARVKSTESSESDEAEG
ncbi:MAG: PH domain-containing protein [Parcubacteria group bacterium]